MAEAGPGLLLLPEHAPGYLARGPPASCSFLGVDAPRPLDPPSAGKSLDGEKGLVLMEPA